MRTTGSGEFDVGFIRIRGTRFSSYATRLGDLRSPVFCLSLLAGNVFELRDVAGDAGLGRPGPYVPAYCPERNEKAEEGGRREERGKGGGGKRN